MHLRRLSTLPLVLALALVSATPADTVAAPIGPRPPAPPTGPFAAGTEPGGESGDRRADEMVVWTHYNDRSEIEIHDLVTGEVRRIVDHVADAARDHVPGDPGHGGGAGDPADDDTVEQSSDGGSEEETPSDATGGPSNRCDNSGEFDYKTAGSRRPWRMAEDLRINPDGAPSAMVSDWRNQILEGARVWSETRDACGFGDVIPWHVPVGTDTTSRPNGTCGNGSRSNGENTVAFADLGGFVNNRIVLGRNCTWSISSTWIVESDMVFNNNPAAQWCNGCSDGDKWDLQSVASHEFGHWLGLGHVEHGENFDTAQAVMHPTIYAGDIRNRKLSRGDVDGARNLYPAAFAYDVVSVELDNPADPHPLAPGVEYTATVHLQNTGFEHWPLADAVLRTDDGAASPFEGSDWLTPSEASDIDRDLTGDWHSNIPNDGSVVVTGERAEFTFQFRPDYSLEPSSGVRTEIERFVGALGSQVSSKAASFSTEIGSLAGQVTGTTGPTFLGVDDVVVQGGFQSAATVTVENTGTAPWITDGDTIRLATDPAGRCSDYPGSDWDDCTDASGIDSAAVVAPGETARFDLRFSSPIDPLLLGPQSEAFTVVSRDRPTRSIVSPTPVVFDFLVI